MGRALAAFEQDVHPALRMESRDLVGARAKGRAKLLQMTPHIYHLALRHAWEVASEEREPYRRSTIDRSLDDEGFIHCSYRDQVQGVADRFYGGRTDVLLLTIDTSKVEAEVRAENGFPHIYGPVPIEAVVRVEPVPWGDDGRLLVNVLLD